MLGWDKTHIQTIKKSHNFSFKSLVFPYTWTQVWRLPGRCRTVSVGMLCLQKHHWVAMPLCEASVSVFTTYGSSDTEKEGKKLNWSIKDFLGHWAKPNPTKPFYQPGSGCKMDANYQSFLFIYWLEALGREKTLINSVYRKKLDSIGELFLYQKVFICCYKSCSYGWALWKLATEHWLLPWLFEYSVSK